MTERQQFYSFDGAGSLLLRASFLQRERGVASPVWSCRASRLSSRGTGLGCPTAGWTFPDQGRNRRYHPALPGVFLATVPPGKSRGDPVEVIIPSGLLSPGCGHFSPSFISSVQEAWRVNMSARPGIPRPSPATQAKLPGSSLPPAAVPK